MWQQKLWRKWKLIRISSPLLALLIQRNFLLYDKYSNNNDDNDKKDKNQENNDNVKKDNNDKKDNSNNNDKKDIIIMIIIIIMIMKIIMIMMIMYRALFDTFFSWEQSFFYAFSMYLYLYFFLLGLIFPEFKAILYKLKI